MSISEMGCCGAYCGTCRVFREHLCKGCKIGYENGDRDLSKAKCRMKVCCVSKKLRSCADCGDYDTCRILNDFYDKNAYKYKKYKEATEYIRANGYDAFLEIADTWKNAYGKYGR
ncbi:MAG: DUF3795 domain-containing protein [Oscillospiraceae bacterium]|nr:DUF3795 domain-containing protein [Oscillospiraceae bacterium]